MASSIYKQIILSPIKIETERLIIQPYQSSDFENSLVLYGDPKITRYFDFGLPRSRAEVEEVVNYYGIFFKKTKYLGLFSIFQKDGMNFIGHVDCIPTDESGILEIGFIMHKRYQRCGFAFEMLKFFIYEYIPAIKYKINKYEIHGIMATVHPKNKPSLKLLETIGMKFDRAIVRFDQPRLQYLLSI